MTWILIILSGEKTGEGLHMTALLIFEVMSLWVFFSCFAAAQTPSCRLLAVPWPAPTLICCEHFLEEGKKSCAKGCMTLTSVSQSLPTLYYLKQHLRLSKFLFWLWYFFIHHVITKWLSSGWLWEISRRKALAIAILLCIQTAYIPPYIFIQAGDLGDFFLIMNNFNTTDISLWINN